jgi:SAM-dependent methyltransferase
MESAQVDRRLSWRDPDGFVVKYGSRILRSVAPAKADRVRSLLNSAWMSGLLADGVVPHTQEIHAPADVLKHYGDWIWLEHEALSFPCYPHEITSLQLFDAAKLTLRVALEAAQNGWVLKDASAWNVLFSDGRGVFVDLLSFDEQDSTGNWIAYGQFVRHFILPLLLFRKVGMTPSDIFLTHRDGITPENAYRMLSAGGLMSLTAMEFIVLPRLLATAGSRLIAAQSTAKATRVSRGSMGGRLLMGTLRHLERKLDSLRPDESAAESVWKSYEEERSHYSQDDLVLKKEFVALHVGSSRTVLDLGCNAGEYSLVAAESGRKVVAADADHPALSRLYSRVRGGKTGISPIILSIGRPTPAVGWQNAEVASFLERAYGHFDCILMLGLIHHILVGERASLPMLVEFLASLRPKSVILEWVDPQDPRFRQLAGLNGALYSSLDADALEAAFVQRFRMIAKLPLPSATRVMYLWES